MSVKKSTEQVKLVKRYEPRVLLFDIETSPNIAKVWGKYEQDVIGDYIQERKIIAVSWKWLNDSKIYAISLPDFYGYKKYIDKNYVREIQNKKLIVKLYNIMSEADIIVAQNGDNFDIKMANAEFIQYGFKPLPPHKTVDTLKIARAKFGFNSNKLDDIGTRMDLGRKVDTGGHKLWEGCLRGEKKYWDHMVAYNKQDVILLEKIYLKFRSWTNTHPNMNCIDGQFACPSCKSTHLRRHGFAITRLGNKPTYQCMDCGRWSTGKAIVVARLS